MYLFLKIKAMHKLEQIFQPKKQLLAERHVNVVERAQVWS